VQRQWTVDNDGHHATEKPSDVWSDDRLLKSLVLGMVEGEDDQDDLYGDGSTTF